MGFRRRKTVDVDGFGTPEFVSPSELVVLDEKIDRLGSILSSYNFTPEEDLQSGTITSKTSISITDSTKNWIVDEFAGKGLRVVTDGLEVDYCRILSNTSDTLTLDCPLADLDITSYRILDTYEIDENMQIIVACDIRNNDCVVVMPSTEVLTDRMFAKVYVELAQNGNHRAVILFKGADKARGSKFISLEHQYEGIDLYVHQWGTYHYDALNIENVKRYASFRVDADAIIPLNIYGNVLTYANTNHLLSKRFIPKNVSDIYWLKYTSVVPATFYLTGTVGLVKEGNVVGQISVTVRVKRFADSSIEDYTDIVSSVKMRENLTPETSLSISVPFKLFPNDEVTIISKTTADTVTMEIGSSFIINEF